MSSNVDAAILDALSLTAAADHQARISSHGGSGFSSTFKLSVTIDDEEKLFFVKTGSGHDAKVMFAGEHASLNALHNAIPDFCPASQAHGELSATPGRHFLVTSFLDLSATSPKGSGVSLAAKLAKLHTTPAPNPDGAGIGDHDPKPMFGFPLHTCCGSTVQDNTWNKNWADFYANCRLRHVLKKGTARNGVDADLSKTVEDVASKVVPRLLDNNTIRDKIVPVLVHGDLWSGNHGRGVQSGGRNGVEEVVFDPSCVYGHSEYELGIMRMFGGFGNAFWKEYHSLVPRLEPVNEWEDRVALYELYHHLNHYAMFGGGYRGGALSIMKKLIKKYG